MIASSRYYLRTALVIAIPLLGVMAAFAALTKEGIVVTPLASAQQRLALVQTMEPARSLRDPRRAT